MGSSLQHAWFQKYRCCDIDEQSGTADDQYRRDIASCGLYKGGLSVRSGAAVNVVIKPAIFAEGFSTTVECGE